MFFFFGISPKTKRFGFVMSRCEVHGGEAQHELASYRSWFKLFFVLPIFPVGRERHLLTCSECGAAYDLSPEEAQQLASQARQDVDVQMPPGFGRGLLGQLFGQPDGRDVQVNQTNQTGQPAWPTQQSQPVPEQQQDVYGTTPMAAPDYEPTRVRSERLDRGE